jgi:integrase
MKDDKNLKFIKGRYGKPGYYVTDITLNYRRVRRFAGYNKEQAKTYLAKLRLASGEGKLNDIIKPQRPTASISFGEYGRRLLDSAEWKQKRSAARDETSFRALNRKFKSLSLTAVKPNIVRDYMTERIKAGLRPASVNRERSLLISILYAAVADGIIESNPIGQKGVKRLEENNSREEKILSMDLEAAKLQKLIDGADVHFRPILEIALLTGMRQGEILSLKWKQIDFDNLKITIPIESSKSKRERVIPMGSDLFKVISNIERMNNSAYVFPSGHTHLKSIRRPFVAACEAAGIKFGRENGLVFHDLRHVAASRLVKMTDVMTASKILGHSDLKTTMRYLHSTDMDKRAAIDRLGAWLRGRQNPVNGLGESIEIQRGADNKNHSARIN